MDCQNSARPKEGETKDSCKGLQRQNVSPRDYRIACRSKQTASKKSRVACYHSAEDEIYLNTKGGTSGNALVNALGSHYLQLPKKML
jgi:hypothetical protein